MSMMKKIEMGNLGIRKLGKKEDEHDGSMNCIKRSTSMNFKEIKNYQRSRKQ